MEIKERGRITKKGEEIKEKRENEKEERGEQ
jgi:hypothetical protein